MQETNKNGTNGEAAHEWWLGYECELQKPSQVSFLIWRSMTFEISQLFSSQYLNPSQNLFAFVAKRLIYRHACRMKCVRSGECWYWPGRPGYQADLDLSHVGSVSPRNHMSSTSLNPCVSLSKMIHLYGKQHKWWTWCNEKLSFFY